VSMKLINLVAVVALTLGCSQKGREQEATTTGTATGQSPACPECAESTPCPECPECEKLDAIYYLVLARVIRGETQSFLTGAYVHRGGAWYPVGGMTPDGPQPSDGETAETFEHGDELLRKVRSDPQRVGIIETDGGNYEQHGPVATSASSAPIEGVRNGQAHLMSFISVLQ
jgi:hypothetical protein